MDRQTLTALVATNPARALADAKSGWRTGEVSSDLALEIITAANEALATPTEGRVICRECNETHTVTFKFVNEFGQSIYTTHCDGYEDRYTPEIITFNA